MSKYTTKIEHGYISIWGINKLLNLPPEIDVDTTCTGRVMWGLDREEREYGVKDTYLTIEKVTVQIEYSYYKDDDGDDIEEGIYEFDSEGLDIENNIEIKASIEPREIEVDFRGDKPKIEIS